MFGQNETNLIGRVGAEPVITTTNSGGRVVTFSVATDESYTNKNGERVQRTEWHRVVTFIPGLVNRIASLQKKGALKGKLVQIRGKSRTRSYQEQSEAKPRYITEILIDMNGIFMPLEKITVTAETAPAPAAPAPAAPAPAVPAPAVPDTLPDTLPETPAEAAPAATPATTPAVAPVATPEVLPEETPAAEVKAAA